MSNAKPLPPIQQGSIQVKKTSSLQAQPVQQFRVQAPVNAQATLKTHIPIQPALKPNTMVPTIQLPTSQVTQNGQIAGQKGGIPFPLLILNNVNHGDKNAPNRMQTVIGTNQQTDCKFFYRFKNDYNFKNPFFFSVAANSLLKEVIELQKQNLELAKQHIEIEKQRLEFDRVIGTQMVTMLPMLGGVLQRLAYPGNQDLIDMKFGISAGVKRKRSASEDADVIKDSKKLRNMLEKGIRKYMLMDEDESQPEVVVEKVENTDDVDDKTDDDIAIDEDDADKNSEKDIEVGSVDGDILEPNVVIENDEDDEEAQADDDEDEDDDEEEKLVIETRRSPRGRPSN